MSETRVWWKAPLRVIQPNLQVQDTAKIDPVKLAEQMVELGANSMVFNVGGIYAWYDTKVTHHYKNSFLPESFDLLKEVISECHKRDIKFIARFDFSKATDSVYQNRPEWFVRNPDGEPQIIGAKRPGEWTLLMSTCTNSKYRTSAVAIPVLDEVMSNYDIDGIFYNAPGFVPCWCEVCRKKYKELYNKELPAKAEEFEEPWSSICVQDNIKHLYSFINNKNPEVPMILYYSQAGRNILKHNDITDMICTESQDILSLGWSDIPPIWKPSLSMKIGRAFEGLPNPFGIIHSSPGMDWRHTGLPSAEYIAWLTQIPASGGSIWHPITGIPDTIDDKRIFKTVGRLNEMVKKVEEHMDGAVLKTRTALLWDGSPAAGGWADGLMNKQVQFNVILAEQANINRMKDFNVIIVPEGWVFTKEFANDLTEFVKSGGNIILEGDFPHDYEGLYDLLGITNEVCRSEKLAASYLRFEGGNNPLQTGMEETELIAHRDKVLYCHPKNDAKVLATLVPPFSSLDAVGAPPERASIPASHTDIPLCILNQFGKGKSLFLPFSLSKLINEFKLEEHYVLMANAINILAGDERCLKITSYQGLQVTVFEKGKNLIVNLVNETGRRPLQQNIKLHDIEIEIKPDNGTIVKNIRQLIVGDNQKFTNENGVCKFILPVLDIWECLLIETK